MRPVPSTSWRTSIKATPRSSRCACCKWRRSLPTVRRREAAAGLRSGARERLREAAASREVTASAAALDAPSSRFVPAYPVPVAVHVAVRGRELENSNSENDRFPQQKCGGGGIRTHEAPKDVAVFKLAVGLREPSQFRMFSNVLPERRPDSSRLVPARIDPLAVHVAVQRAS